MTFVVVTSQINIPVQPVFEVFDSSESDIASFDIHFAPSVPSYSLPDPRVLPTVAPAMSPSPTSPTAYYATPAAIAASSSFTASAVAGWLVAGAGSATTTAGALSTTTAVIPPSTSAQTAPGTIPLFPSDPNRAVAEPNVPLVEVPNRLAAPLAVPEVQPQPYLVGPQWAQPTQGAGLTPSSAIAASASVDGSRAEPLAAGFALNFAAVDAAFDELLGEVETLGEGLVDWLDDGNLSPWTVAGAAAAAAAGGFYFQHRRRRRSSQAADGEEETSSWLFLNLQLPRVQA